MKATPVSAAPAFGFATTMVRTDVPLGAMIDGANDLVAVGAEPVTVSCAVALVALLPFEVCNAPAAIVLVAMPAKVEVTSTRTTHEPAVPPLPAGIARVGGSVLRRLARALGVGGADSRLAVAWHEAATGGVSYRSVVLDLSELPEGMYHIALTIGSDSASHAVTYREIRLVGAPTTPTLPPSAPEP